MNPVSSTPIRSPAFCSWTASRLRYYLPPVIASVSPQAGPLDGDTMVTIRGELERYLSTPTSALIVQPGDSGYKCRWGECSCQMHTDCDCENVTTASYAKQASALLCTSPPWLGSSVTSQGETNTAVHAPVHITLNGQDWSLALPNFTRYSHQRPGFALLQVHPTFGPTAGGTIVHFRPMDEGSGGSEYVCRFGAVKVPASRTAADGASTLLACASPANEVGSVAIYISLNGQQYVPLGRDGEEFEYYAEVSIATLSPASGPLEGGTTVQVRGRWHSRSPTNVVELLRCRFGTEVVPASRVGADVILCESPQLSGVSTAAIAFPERVRRARPL